MDYMQPAGLLHPRGFSRQEYWRRFPVLLQGIFPTQGLSPGLPHCRWILYQLSHIPGSGRSPGGGHGMSRAIKAGIATWKWTSVCRSPAGTRPRASTRSDGTPASARAGSPVSGGPVRGEEPSPLLNVMEAEETLNGPSNCFRTWP